MNADTITEDRVITLNFIDEREITIDYGKSLEAMVERGWYNWANSNITADRFPVEGVGIKTFRTKLFRFDGYISSEDAVAAIKEEGFEPATHVHGLGFGASYPGEQLRYPIVCLGSSAVVVGSRCVMCLCRGGAKRYLRLHPYFWLGGWDGRWRFPGVQEVSAT